MGKTGRRLLWWSPIVIGIISIVLSLAYPGPPRAVCSKIAGAPTGDCPASSNLALRLTILFIGLGLALMLFVVGKVWFRVNGQSG